jgi:hypothetical protein
MKPATRFFSLLLCLSLLIDVFPVYSQDRQKPASGVVAPEISVKDSKLTVKNATVGKQLIIYTIIGNKVRQIDMKTADGEYELKLSRGIYLFKLENIVKKIVIK